MEGLNSIIMDILSKNITTYKNELKISLKNII